MKTDLIKIVLGIAIFYVCSLFSSHAQIYSTTSGGLWSDPGTWVNGIVPTITDDVVINGLVQTANNYESCDNLSIASNGWLMDNGNQSNLYVYGSLTNNGKIETNISYYAIWLWGDFINNGIADFDRVYLNGTSDQHISCQINKTIEIDYFYGYSHNRRIIATSDIAFVNSEINMNYDTLTIESGKIISLSGGNISSGCFLVPENAGDTYTLTMSANAYVRQSSIRNAILAGTIQTADIVSFYGNTVNNGVLQGYPSISSGLNFYDTFLNNGTIQSNFSIQVYADIVNNGIWNNYSIYFNKTEDQYFSCLNGNAFECDYFIEYNHEGRLIALTDAYFVNCEVNMNADTLTMASGTNIYLSGGKIYQSTFVPEYLSETFTLTMTDDAYITSGDFYSATLEGTILNYGVAKFYGNTINNGILQKHPWSTDGVYLYDDFLNNGTIQSSFSILVYGDIVNNGFWNNYGIYFQSPNDQHFSCLNGNSFEVTQFVDYNNTGKLIAQTDVSFINTSISFYDTLTIATGKTLSLSGGDIYQATIVPEDIQGSFILMMTDDSKITVGKTYNATLEGIIQTYGIVEFYGNTVNNGSIYKDAYSTDPIKVYGHFLNNGIITDIEGWTTIDAYGDITNNGEWLNFRTFLRGAIDQNINIQNQHTILSEMYFISDIQVSPYQWYFNGGAIGLDDGFTGYDWVQLGFENPLSTSYEGTYFCSTGGGLSRNIFVNAIIGNVVLDLKAFLEGPYNGTEMETKLTIADYLPAAQPYNQAPWNYAGSEISNPIPNSNVVDWVLVELRDAQDPVSASTSEALARRAALVLKDGSIVAIDGHSKLNFGPIPILNNLFAVVWHRTHLPVMSSDALNQNAGDYSWDFSAFMGQAYDGANAHKEIATGIWGMIAGDGNADGLVSYPDKNDVWNNQAGLRGYFSGDFNLDGLVNNLDKNEFWLPNFE